uniref:Pectinesterase n=1 Tax=Solanum tuberosum TaxID=4113 RepID=M1DPN2_SOLTU
MAALSACPNNSIAQYFILIKQGIYEEYVQIDSWKTNIVFIGEGMDKTIISGNKSYGGGIGTYYTATVGVDGVGFMAQDITFRNTAGPANYQAVALRASVRKPMKGQYIAITAQQRNDNGPTGLVLQNCTLRLATPDVGDNLLCITEGDVLSRDKSAFGLEPFMISLRVDVDPRWLGAYLRSSSESIPPDTLASWEADAPRSGLGSWAVWISENLYELTRSQGTFAS